jgi:glycosyltransferase involved in cell wall biosynthesis
MNEAQTIGQVLDDIRQHHDFDIVVVDDGSTDDTAIIARAHGARVLPHIRSLGAWKATQTGIRYAFNQSYDSVVTMDADGQHLGSQIQSLLNSVGDGSDVIIGSCSSRASALRLIAWHFFRTASGVDVKDITSGFRFYNLAALRVLSTKEATMLDFQDLGVLLLLRSLDLSIEEVEVDMNERVSGKSRIFNSWFSVMSYMVTTGIVCLTKAIPLRDVRYLKRFY